MSSSSLLPTISSLLPSATQSSISSPLSLLPHDAGATSSHLQQFLAVRQLTRDLQQRKQRHPKRPQLPSGEAGSPTKKIFHTAVYKQTLPRYNNALKLFEQNIDQLLFEQDTELDNIIANVYFIANKLTPPPPLPKSPQ